MISNILLNNPASNDDVSINIRNRISNAVPVSLPSEPRQEILQMMLLDIAERIDSVVKNTSEYVHRYYREQGAAAKHVYLDHDDGLRGRSLAERLVG